MFLNTVMGCRPGIDFNLRDGYDKRVYGEQSLIFTVIIKNATHIVCRGGSQRMGHADSPIEFVRDAGWFFW